MTGNLAESIAQANQKAGRERGKLFAKKSYLKVTDASIIDMLCDRGGELITALREGPAGSVVEAERAFRTAVTIARRHREGKR